MRKTWGDPSLYKQISGLQEHRSFVKMPTIRIPKLEQAEYIKCYSKHVASRHVCLCSTALCRFPAHSPVCLWCPCSFCSSWGYGQNPWSYTINHIYTLKPCPSFPVKSARSGLSGSELCWRQLLPAWRGPHAIYYIKRVVMYPLLKKSSDSSAGHVSSLVSSLCSVLHG